jgi:hypothetical protein
VLNPIQYEFRYAIKRISSPWNINLEWEGEIGNLIYTFFTGFWRFFEKENKLFPIEFTSTSKGKIIKEMKRFAGILFPFA